MQTEKDMLPTPGAAEEEIPVPADGQAEPESGSEQNPPAAEPDREEKTQPDRADEFAAMAEEDLAQLRQIFPALRSLPHLGNLPNARRYGELREAGLTPEEALRATHPDLSGGGLVGEKSHLRSSAPRFAAARGGIGAADLSAARDLFPDLSDREIDRLWRRTAR